jgi:hypothetical protein
MRGNPTKNETILLLRSIIDGSVKEITGKEVVVISKGLYLYKNELPVDIGAFHQKFATIQVKWR